MKRGIVACHGAQSTKTNSFRLKITRQAFARPCSLGVTRRASRARRRVGARPKASRKRARRPAPAGPAPRCSHARGEVLAPCATMKRLLSSASACSGGQAFVALVDAHRRVGAVERGHERLRLRADDEAVDRPPVRLAGRRGRAGRTRSAASAPAARSTKSWKPGPPIVRSSLPLTASTASRIASASSLRRFMPPEQSGCRRRSARRSASSGRRLPVRRAGDDQPVQLLERAAAVAELGRQPVEQLGVRRQLRPCGRSRSACRRARGRSGTARRG